MKLVKTLALSVLILSSAYNESYSMGSSLLSHIKKELMNNEVDHPGLAEFSLWAGVASGVYFFLHEAQNRRVRNFRDMAIFGAEVGTFVTFALYITLGMAKDIYQQKFA